MHIQEILTAIVVFSAVLFVVLRWTGLKPFKKKPPHNKPDVKTEKLLRKKKKNSYDRS